MGELAGRVGLMQGGWGFAPLFTRENHYFFFLSSFLPPPRGSEELGPFGCFVRAIVHIVQGLALNCVCLEGRGVLLSCKWDLNSLSALGWHSACGLNFNFKAYS